MQTFSASQSLLTDPCNGKVQTLKWTKKIKNDNVAVVRNGNF